MSVVFKFSLFMMMFFVFGSCSHLEKRSFQFEPSKPIAVRFQNLLSLEVGQAGCSLFNLGGLERMSKYAKAHPVDLSFQIGPAFSTIFNKKISDVELREKRKQIWKSWEEQGVGFYSVDGKDLEPSLSEFKNIQSDKIILLSSNLKRDSGDWLFEPLVKLEVSGVNIAVLSFSEGAENGEGWKTENLESAIKELEEKLCSDFSLIYVLGSLKADTRSKIAAQFSRPVLFLGGANGEKNTTEIVSLGKTSFYAKSPDLGRGYSEMIIGKVGGNFSHKQKLKIIGGLSHSFASRILRDDSEHSNHCFHGLEKKEPQQK